MTENEKRIFVLFLKKIECGLEIEIEIEILSLFFLINPMSFLNLKCHLKRELRPNLILDQLINI